MEVSLPDGAESVRYPVQAVERALTILLLLADSPGLRPLGVTDVATRLGVSKSTAHRLLTTLVKYNFVTRGDPGGKYRLGWALYEVARRLPHATGVHAIAQPLILEASGELGETVNLAVRSGDKMVIIESLGAPTALRVDPPKGVPCPLHTSSLGKALLLDLDQAALRQLLGGRELAATSPRSITTVEDLCEDLAVSRRRGFTLDDEEGAEGVRCAGAPVRDHQGEIVAAVSVSGPTQRLAGERLAQAAGRIRQLALRISRGIGFEGEAVI